MIVVASVSCIYGLGDPQAYFESVIFIETGDKIPRTDVFRRLVQLQFQRNDTEFSPGTFRVRGDVLEVCPAGDDERSIRIEFFGDEVEEISEIERLSGKTIRRLNSACIYPASHFVTSKENLAKAIKSIRAELRIRLPELEREGKLLEAQRLEQRTLYDLELLEEMGLCSGIENYSRHLTGRAPGEAPPTLIDYFPPDFLLFIDESHVSIPQVVGMYRGDRARKQTLVDYGFRLPSALDNRPLKFEEFCTKISQTVYISATPAQYEINESRGEIVEQIIRPTGLLDPVVEIRPASTQVDDFLGEVRRVVAKGDRVLVTTLTKKMSEHLTKYYQDLGVRVKYLHSDIHTLDRVDLIRGLRSGEFDLLVGINLLREGLDLPEVSLVGIMDGDKEGFLRSTRSLIQTIGRAARNVEGVVIIYADKITDSIEQALAETNRRREKQHQYNLTHGITPRSVKRSPQSALVEQENALQALVDAKLLSVEAVPRDINECKQLLTTLRKEMFDAAKSLEFEKAATLRDRVALIEKHLYQI